MIKKKNVVLYIGLTLTAALLVIAIFGPVLAPYSLEDNVGIHTEVVNGETKMIVPPIPPFEDINHWLGTDRWGYDVWTMLLFGARYTIFVAFIVAALKVVIGALIGLMMGLRKKQPIWWTTFEEMWGYVPGFLVVYFLLLPITMNPTLSPLTLTSLFVIVMILIGVPSVTSSIREKTIQLKREPFIEASRILGASKWGLIRRHFLPHFRVQFLLLFVLEIVYTLTMMGQLALFNLFVGGTIYQPDSKLYISITKEWAGLIGQARPYLYWGESYLLFVPLCFLVVAILTFHLLAKGLQLHFDHTYKKTRWY
ncbi:ABC transporter permease [Metabacillus iocasae]|uniref:Peptide/nickel transport system permease protein n=1 Tax=Priestia iocasae TaxID=2291674 RepID=A0ABS2QU71_9BACI|nr:ABC transporter permease subunit [Metabacillus iocasae]MBM7703026.1 peptide/nickel transport system permease protein [Metabacillus iocasae]